MVLSEVAKAKVKAGRRNGNVVLTGCGLNDVPDEVYDINSVVLDDEKWWELVDVTRMSLSRNDIGELSNDVMKLKSLTAFDVDHNRLAALPPALFSLHDLTRLDVSHNALTEIGDGLGGLSSLVELRVGSNRLTALPQSLTRLTQLQILDASENAISRLPDGMDALGQLTTVLLAGNQLERLPRGFDRLHRITTLQITRNRLVELPPMVCPDLKSLDVSDNALETLPDLSASDKLSELTAKSNRLRSLPAGLFRHPSLTVLIVSSNRLESLPDEMDAAVCRLARLDVSANELKILPPTLGRVETLTNVVYDGNPMRTIRPGMATRKLLEMLRERIPVADAASMAIDEREVASGRNLMVHDTGMRVREAAGNGKLDMAKRELRVLEDDLIVDGLTLLDVQQNALTDLPAALASRAGTTLTTITAGRNAFTGLPPVLAQLGALASLDLSACRLVELAPGILPPSLEVLTISGNAGVRVDAAGLPPSLRELHAERCNFSGPLADAFYSLRKLRHLNLSNNRIESVDERILQLGELNVLNLANNEMRQILPQLGIMPAVTMLQVSGNPVRTIRQHILNGTTEALMDYLKNRIPQ